MNLEPKFPIPPKIPTMEVTKSVVLPMFNIKVEKCIKILKKYKGYTISTAVEARGGRSLCLTRPMTDAEIEDAMAAYRWEAAAYVAWFEDNESAISSAISDRIKEETRRHNNDYNSMVAAKDKLKEELVVHQPPAAKR